MSLRAGYYKKTFHFNFKARTSRGLMKDKTSYFIKLWNDERPDVIGIGECGPLEGLSVDYRPDFENILLSVIENINVKEQLQYAEIPSVVPAGFSSIIFGLETALLDLNNGGERIIFQNEFISGSPIDINGLIWMGDIDFMMTQVSKKIADGFHCIKLKVGGLDFDRECDVLNYIRKKHFRDNITLRLDANGAFKLDDVLYKLEELARFGIHSIEQPIRPGQDEMEELCRKSPIPVAFDEELIGIENREAKVSMLKKLKPQFIVLKPTLHGGLQGCAEWIEIAEELGIGWWMTSALESSIGLNAICQFTSNYDVALPQGLGTGMIYENNISSPLTVKQGKIFYSHQQSWDVLE